MIPAWFLYVQGFAMLLLGAGQLMTRPRRPGDTWMTSHFASARIWGTLWSAVCISVGVALLAMALGWWQPSFVSPPAAAPRAPRHAR